MYTSGWLTIPLEEGMVLREYQRRSGEVRFVGKKAESLRSCMDGEVRQRVLRKKKPGRGALVHTQRTPV